MAAIPIPLSAAELLHQGEVEAYWDRKAYTSITEQLQHSLKSTTLYIGNLNFATTEEKLISYFSSAGPIKKVILGINRNTKEPCGFAFIFYEDKSSARDAVNFLHATKLDDRILRVELDPGFYAGRQYGRGSSGG